MAITQKMEYPLHSGFLYKKAPGYVSSVARNNFLTKRGNFLPFSVLFLGKQGRYLKMYDGENWKTIASLETDQTFTGTNTFSGSSVLNGALSGTSIKDEDTMVSDSATAVPTQQSVKAYVGAYASNAWAPANESWAYASATTITVPSGAAAKYAVGDKIKLTQTTVKYFYVVGVADTVLTVTGGDDYSVANAAITDNYYSHATSPIDFPQFFAFTPTVTAGSGTFTTVAAVAAFSLQGRTCYFKVEVTTTDAGTAATETRVTLPIAPAENERDIGSGLERWNTGDALVIRPISSTVAGIRNYVNGFNGGAGSIQICSLSYEV